MAKSKSQRMKEYRSRKKQQLGDVWLGHERGRIRAYRVPVSELSIEEQEHKREMNRKHCATYRKKRKAAAMENDQDIARCDQQNIRDEAIDENGVSSTTDINVHSPLTVKMPFNTPQSSSRQSRGRKRVSRALAKQYRKNERLESENEMLKRKLNTTRKKLNRLEHTHKVTPNTPKSKTEKLLRDNGIDPSRAPEVKQKLLFAECIAEEIKKASRVNNASLVRPVVSGEKIKKYRMKKRLSESTGVNRRNLNGHRKLIEIRKRTRREDMNNKINKDIREFLERDDNSRMLPGKADAVKVGKGKVQKRVLNDYMYNLHTKFQAESSYKVSHATFCRKKPPSIAHVNFSRRSVCLCQRHQNFALKLRCLKNYKISAITSPDKFMEIYNTEEALDVILQGIDVTSVRFQEWKRQKMKDGKQKMRVVDIELPKEEFITLMKQTYQEFANHIKKVVAQYKGVKEMKEKLPEDHVLVQMDFSENYCCQNLEEVQSAYWNATAITLHPTVMYKKNENGQLEHKSVVFVSEVLNHNASMVLVISEKVIEIAKEYVPDLKAIHFWTDSPTSQYRNKTVFDFISRLDSLHGITGSWQFFEAGHGKGPCDGIGGTTKRNADNAIKQGKIIIQDADDFFKWASESDSQIQYVKVHEEEYNCSRQRVENESGLIKPIKGTMKIHSVVSISPGCLRTRETTCVCNDSFKENGFSDTTLCMWIKQNMTMKKPVRAVIDENNNESESGSKPDENDVRSEEKSYPISGWKLDDFVVVVYDKRCYIGQITDIDEEDGEVEVNCMEECGKVEGRYKWPRQPDKIWTNNRNVLKAIEAPKPTGRSQRMFSVDNEINLFMKGKCVHMNEGDTEAND